jgi:uncharacterized protein YutE (UPF0331/DUF86 family)
MNDELLNLAERIRAELRDIERVVQRIQSQWKRFQRTSDDAYLDGVALNLHGFYEGLERLFLLIAATIDKKQPQGAEWHQELLLQVQNELPGIRPLVISEQSRRALEKFRGFRHVVRHIYTFNIDAQQMSRLVVDVTPLFERLRGELSTFADFLEQRARDPQE